MKLIDAVVPQADLVKAAKDWIKAGGKAKNPWDVDGFRLPGGPVYSKAGMMTFSAANAIYRRETCDNYPAARAMLQVVYEGLQLPIDLALRVESRWFAKILRSPEAAAMMRSLFVSMQDLNKGARRPADVPPKPRRRVGIIGAGFMGAGIGYVTARAGIDVVLIDRDQESADKGKAQAQAPHRRSRQQGPRHRGRARRAPLPHHAQPPTTRRSAIAISSSRRCSRIAGSRPKPWRGPQAVLDPQAGVVFASNTSTLPITSLAGELKDPSRFIGIHFFSPVERMMLVEIIRGRETGKAALAAALDYVRALRKTPIVVNDSRGFYTSRVVGTYIREGHLMLAEGVPAAMIENLGRMAGMPVGPLSLNDEVAVDLAWKILAATEADLGPDDDRSAPEGAVVRDGARSAAASAARTARAFTTIRKAGRSGCGRASPTCSRRSSIRTPSTVEELKDRLLGIQALETARCFEENVLTDVREADVGSILGFGFAPFTGGTLSYIDMMGTRRFVALCEKLAAKFGARFAPCRLLVDMAANSETFYGRFAPARRDKAA